MALAELKGLAKTLPKPEILLNAVVLKEARTSSEVENIITTQDRLYQALAAKSVIPDPATKEVLSYREAIFAGCRFIQEKGFLSINGIVEIQEKLEGNRAGIRRLPGTALKNDATGETIYIPPDDLQVLQDLLRNLEQYLNTEEDEPPLSPLIKMAVQHYQFESIHPFYDGNGRTGRIINILYLILQNRLDNPLLYLSAYIIGNKGRYYQLLQKVRTEAAWEAWILFMLTGLEQTALETCEKIRQVNFLLENTLQLVKEKAPTVYSKELVELLFEEPYSKIDFLTDRAIAKRKTAGKYLNELVAIGILEKVTVGKENLYINKELFQLFRQ